MGIMDDIKDKLESDKNEEKESRINRPPRRSGRDEDRGPRNNPPRFDRSEGGDDNPPRSSFGPPKEGPGSKRGPPEREGPSGISAPGPGQSSDQGPPGRRGGSDRNPPPPPSSSRKQPSGRGRRTDFSGPGGRKPAGREGPDKGPEKKGHAGGFDDLGPAPPSRNEGKRPADRRGPPADDLSPVGGPGPGGESQDTASMERIARQNKEIIGLLKDIRDSLRGRRR